MRITQKEMRAILAPPILCQGGCGLDLATDQNYYAFDGNAKHRWCIPCGVTYLKEHYPHYMEVDLYDTTAD